MFRSRSLNKDMILSSEDNRFRCDSQSEKKKEKKNQQQQNEYVARKEGWMEG